MIVLDEGEIQSLPDSVNHYHRFSIGSLLRMPIDGFERQERAKIANIVLSRVLRIGETMEVEVIRNHVNLLIKCMELPNKAMDLVSNDGALELYLFLNCSSGLGPKLLVEGSEGSR